MDCQYNDVEDMTSVHWNRVVGQELKTHLLNGCYPLKKEQGDSGYNYGHTGGSESK